MSQNLYIVLCIAVGAVITFLTRAIPFLVFGKRKLPFLMSYLGSVLPPAIMIILVCYCLRHVDVSCNPYGLPELISCVVVCFVHVMRKNMYVSIISGTVCYMFLLRVMY